MRGIKNPCEGCSVNAYYACYCIERARYDASMRKGKEEDGYGLGINTCMCSGSCSGVKVSEVNR